MLLQINNCCTTCSHAKHIRDIWHVGNVWISMAGLQCITTILDCAKNPFEKSPNQPLPFISSIQPILR